MCPDVVRRRDDVLFLTRPGFWFTCAIPFAEVPKTAPDKFERKSDVEARVCSLNRLRTQPHNMSYPRTRELTTALNSMETWWSSANQGNGRGTTTLTNGGGSSSALTTINRGALSAQLQSSVPRVHPAVIDAERYTPASQRLHPLTRLHAENQALRAQLLEMLAQGKPVKRPPGSSVPVSPTGVPAIPEVPTPGRIADEAEQIANEAAAKELAATTATLARSKAQQVAAVMAEQKAAIAEVRKQAEAEKKAAVEKARREARKEADAEIAKEREKTAKHERIE